MDDRTIRQLTPAEVDELDVHFPTEGIDFYTDGEHWMAIRTGSLAQGAEPVVELFAKAREHYRAGVIATVKLPRPIGGSAP